MTTTITIQITAQAPDPMTAQAAIRLALAALSPAQPQTVPPPAPPPPTEKEEPRNGDSPKPATELPDLDKIDLPPHRLMGWLNAGHGDWKQLHHNEQVMVAKHFLATLVNSRDPGAPLRPTGQEWDAAKPDWMPAAKHIPALVGATWRAWLKKTMNEMATDDLFPQP